MSRAMPPSKAKDGSYHYSGEGSRQFWLRVNSFHPNPKLHMKLYSLGCKLQNFEEKVLKELCKREAARHAAK